MLKANTRMDFEMNSVQIKKYINLDNVALRTKALFKIKTFSSLRF